MPGIVMTIPNAFKGSSDRLKDYVPSLEVDSATVDTGTVTFATGVTESQMSDRFARRPLSGIAIKPNTHAYVQVADAKGRPVKVFNQLGAITHGPRPPPQGLDAGAPQDDYWTDWLLQSVTESRAEKTQIVETFGDPVLYVFGERPRVLQFSAILANTMDFNWRAEFWENWDKYFRATKLVESGHRLYIGFDDIVVSGYPLGANAVQSAMDPHVIKVSFNLFVTDYMNTYMSEVGSVQAARLRQPQDIKTVRLAEFVPQSSFIDEAHLQAADGSGDLARAVGGSNLAFREYYNRVFGGLSNLGVSFGGQAGGSASLSDVLFDPGLRHVRGAKSATDFLLTHLNKQALRYAYAGVEAAAKYVPGGVPGLTFWFGLTAHLYQQTAINAIQAAGGRTTENKWVNLLDNINTIGNPFGVATTLGYAANAMLGTALRDATGQLELSNMEYDPAFGLVAKRQNASLGAKISYREDPEFSSSSKTYYSTNVAVAPAKAGASYSGVGSSQPVSGQFVSDPVVSSSSSQVDGAEAYNAQRAREEEVNAVEAQNSSLEVNHGGATVVDYASDVEDDGSEED